MELLSLSPAARTRVHSAAMKPRFFRDPLDFRAWLEANHATATEVWVGYYKKASGKGGLVYQQALEQALCFGWIDGRVNSIDDERYMQRFTPRTARSYWSAVNIRKAEALIAAGQMATPGLAAFRARGAAPPGRYSNENKGVTLDAAMIERFKTRKKAWEWFEGQPASFKRLAAHWVTSAKREETRESRLTTLIACATRGERPPGFPGAAPTRTVKRRKPPSAVRDR
jgi:uncharacterized protein YdeI (YjbR/CyaY-like superfamily)